jgi:hypothetical protein
VSESGAAWANAPGALTALAAAGAGIVGILAGTVGGSGPLPAAAATGIVVFGLSRGSRRLLAIGSLGLVAAGVVNGLTPGPEAAVPVTIGGGLLAWDFAATSLDLRTQFPPAADTTRLEGVHVAVATGVVALGVAVALVGTRFVGPVGSAGATFLLLAVIGLLVGLNNLR